MEKSRTTNTVPNFAPNDYTIQIIGIWSKFGLKVLCNYFIV